MIKTICVLLALSIGHQRPNWEAIERAALLANAKAALRGEFPLNEIEARAEAIRRIYRLTRKP